MTSMTQRRECLFRAKPGHRIHLALEKLKMTFSSRPHTEEQYQGLGVQMHSSNKAIQRCPQRHSSPIPRETIPRTRETIPRTWSSKVSLLSSFTSRISRLGLAQTKTTDKTKSQWGGFTVLDLLTTKALVLSGFGIVHP